MPDPNPNQAISELIIRLLLSALEETSGVLKLYFTVSTGAVVLFTNLLVLSRVPKLVGSPLALATIAFGAVSVFCLYFLIGLAKYRLILVASFATGTGMEELKKNLDDWEKIERNFARWLEGLFWAGIAFSIIFVLFVLTWR